MMKMIIIISTNGQVAGMIDEIGTEGDGQGPVHTQGPTAVRAAGATRKDNVIIRNLKITAENLLQSSTIKTIKMLKRRRTSVLTWDSTANDYKK